MVKQRRWVLVATAAAAAAVGLLIGSRMSGPPSPVVAASPPPVAAVASSPAALAPSMPASVAATSLHDSEEIEICGLGFVPADEAAQVLQNGFSPAPEVVARVSGSLRASTTAPARALGLWLPAIDAAARATTTVNEEMERCGDDQSCIVPLRNGFFETLQEATRPGVDALAREAAGTEDAAVYAMAVQACLAFDPRMARGGNCQLVTVERWAQLDPDNAVPWTYLASAALSRNDGDAAGEALYRASIADVSRLYGDSLLAMAKPALASGFTDVQRLQLANELIGVQAGWTLPSFSTPMKMCSDEALRDGNRRQICDAYASMLIEKGNTLIERAIGIRLGERLHWPTERLEALRDEREALSLAMTEDNVSPDGSFSCDAQKRAIEAALRTSTPGEIGRARAAIATSGRSLDDWTRRGRERRQRLAVERASASAASAAAPH
jgi:hypothetical protein